MTDVEVTNEQVVNEIANVAVVVKYGNGTAGGQQVNNSKFRDVHQRVAPGSLSPRLQSA
jgi:hypothetical protein